MKSFTFDYYMASYVLLFSGNNRVGLATPRRQDANDGFATEEAVQASMARFQAQQAEIKENVAKEAVLEAANEENKAEKAEERSHKMQATDLMKDKLQHSVDTLNILTNAMEHGQATAADVFPALNKTIDELNAIILRKSVDGVEDGGAVDGGAGAVHSDGESNGVTTAAAAAAGDDLDVAKAAAASINMAEEVVEQHGKDGEEAQSSKESNKVLSSDSESGDSSDILRSNANNPEQLLEGAGSVDSTASDFFSHFDEKSSPEDMLRVLISLNDDEIAVLNKEDVDDIAKLSSKEEEGASGAGLLHTDETSSGTSENNGLHPNYDNPFKRGKDNKKGSTNESLVDENNSDLMVNLNFNVSHAPPSPEDLIVTSAMFNDEEEDDDEWDEDDDNDDDWSDDNVNGFNSGSRMLRDQTQGDICMHPIILQGPSYYLHSIISDALFVIWYVCVSIYVANLRSNFKPQNLRRPRM